MITHIIWDLGDTLVNPPHGGQDLKPLDQCLEVQLRPYVKTTLKELSDLGYKHAVLSNTATSDSKSARRLLNRLGVEDCFEFIYATQSELTQDKPQKPDPEVFEIVLKALDIKPDQAVMIGNSWDNDVIGANRCGIHAIWLTNPSLATRRDQTTQVQSPPWVIPVYDLPNLPQAIRILREAEVHSIP